MFFSYAKNVAKTPNYQQVIRIVYVEREESTERHGKVRVLAMTLRVSGKMYSLSLPLTGQISERLYPLQNF